MEYAEKESENSQRLQSDKEEKESLREEEQEEEQLVASITNGPSSPEEIATFHEEEEINDEALNLPIFFNDFPQNDCFSAEQNAVENYNNIRFLLTNARSLSPKILSLVDSFDELQLHLAVVTESWLSDSEVLDNDLIDLEHGTDLKAIYVTTFCTNF